VRMIIHDVEGFAGCGVTVIDPCRDTPHAYQDRQTGEARASPYRHGRACPGHPRSDGRG
jgi:hypothetical protein